MDKAIIERERFKGTFNRLVNRTGAAELLKWLESTDFFTAPAGAKHHGAYPGGLVHHSLNVYDELRKDFISRKTSPDAPGLYFPNKDEDETLAICGLLHDVCKAGVYHQKDGGEYTYDDPFPLGHGEKSLFLISRYMRLTDEEALAIRWHMGPWDYAVRGGERALDSALDFSDLVQMLQQADERATRAERKQERREAAENGSAD